MDKIIQNLPNNTIAIICSIKTIDANFDNYALVPEEVAIGKIDPEGIFVVEDTNQSYMEVTKFEETYIDENSKYYLFPMEISELQKKYPNSTQTTELAVYYFKDVRDKITLLYKVPDKEEIMIESVEKRSKEDLRKLNEKIEQQYHEKKFAITKKDDEREDVDLSSIKRADLAKYLKERILKNDSLMDDIATAIVANFRTNNPKLIKNILCVGPTGSGKTETFRLIAKYANLPITEIDCNQLTAEGFVGKGVDDIFKRVYATSGGNIAKAERSILILDEVDKLASRGDPIKDLDVQQSLLKVLEGYNFSFENKRGGSQIQLDTTFMTKVASGAFMDLFDKRKVKHALGFNQEDEPIESKKLTDKDIIDYGFLPEFVGRLPLVYTYQPLDADTLKIVLANSKISPLNLMIESLQEKYGTTFEYDDDFLDAIVEYALLTEAGGRSLAKIIQSSFIKLEGALIDETDLGHQIPKTLKLSKDMISNPTNFNL